MKFVLCFRTTRNLFIVTTGSLAGSLFEKAVDISSGEKPNIERPQF